MNLSKTIKIILVVSLMTTFLTWFYYVHEKLPKPLRAITALVETPVAIASGISFYLNLGIPVYQTYWAIIISNLFFSVCFVFIFQVIVNRQNRKRNK